MLDFGATSFKSYKSKIVYYGSDLTFLFSEEFIICLISFHINFIKFTTKWKVASIKLLAINRQLPVLLVLQEIELPGE